MKRRWIALLAMVAAVSAAAFFAAYANRQPTTRPGTAAPLRPTAR